MDYTAFLEGRQTDDKGRTIDSILRWSNLRLELSHNYIQRVFPTDESSKYARSLKPISPSDISSLVKSEASKNNIRKAYIRMLSLWKLDDENYKRKIYRYWNHRNNHNHLRITRILKCFKLIQMNDELKDFSIRLSYLLNNDHGLKISKKTEDYWRDNLYKKMGNEYDSFL